MGHNNKTASRDAKVKEARQFAVDALKATGALGKRFEKGKNERDEELLELERRVLGEIEKVLELHIELTAEFELHRRPWYRKAIDWIKAKPFDLEKPDQAEESDPHYLGAVEIDADPENLDPELGEPEIIDLDFEEDDQADDEPKLSAEYLARVADGVEAGKSLGLAAHDAAIELEADEQFSTLQDQRNLAREPEKKNADPSGE